MPVLKLKYAQLLCEKGYTWNQNGFFKGFSYGDSQKNIVGSR
jgi:hypothetical protein